MGVDYDGVGGIGTPFTDDMVQRAIDLGVFTKEEWEDDATECMEKIRESYSIAGNYYSGDISYYLFVRGDTLKEVNDNAPGFVERVSRFAPGLTVDALKVISDILIS